MPAAPSLRQFTTVLVANRGEIACRVTGTLHRLGVRSVAVHTAADADARHVREADVAIRLEPVESTHHTTHPHPRAAYLDVDAIIGAAAATGAEAVHPGYGFLSESPALARACERAGLTFVGPPAEVLELMGDKLAAKRLVAAHGVPVLPGTLDGASLAAGTPAETLAATARDVGFPLLVKPAAGGGGKGMVVVRSPEALPAALDSARRVAAASFGDDTLLIERLVDRPRHIEVQVLADAHGAVVHLGERECTLQRRYQKVVEEAPSPALDDAARARLGAAACAVARAVGYVGAGTVEFLVPADDPSSFWFIEMNTRLQVEHPVTELVTGLDLVELQLHVAAGEPLPFTQSGVHVTGHAVEARLYAESPARGFLPATGRVLVYDDAGVAAGPDARPLRLDSGLTEGAEVTADFDPLLAKAVAHAATRTEALDRLDHLLATITVLGVDTNQSFLRTLLADDDVRAARLDTTLIDRLITSPATPATPLSGPGRALPPPDPDSADHAPASSGPPGGLAHREPAIAVATVAVVAVVAAAFAVLSRAAGHGRGPWAVGDGWRLNADPVPRRVLLADGDVDGDGDGGGDGGGGVGEHVVSIAGPLTDAVVTVDRGDAAAAWRPDARPHTWWFTLDGVTRRCLATIDDGGGGDGDGSGAPPTVWVAVDGRVERFAVLDRTRQAARSRTALAKAAPGAPQHDVSGEVRAAMPGTVAAVTVADGESVAPGATVVVVEAMKMEHPLTAPRGGTVRLRVQPGDQVRLDQVVAVVESPTTESPITETDAADPADPVPHSATRGAP
ncbi:Carbamoyl-phosphate synthase L chain ATP- binding protein [Xylanimonas cellulosilytica DSM 15894]|uniref:biotin carboxylase n=1 Tax=Xylanimonas cellulosilytica (strain DSM 15894 / JCM 12276 / CECT 5975 / KCTC 9989 / LMG 20990 / NBRC 107835 / XIL07) TaxID=446471 RepID=D1BUA6_XYLCX|nr:biotin carboxylase N-terminal domain-containing protein [Xylanimonas cellulosilytica]ACZ31119.1 Carbamoyl-phosphate synthase L chain ATP- binding protein [Xylanimonas cellulosilytica DSM 15894]